MGGNLTRKKGHKGTRKHRRSYRWAGVEHSVTKYRDRHRIPKDAKR